MAKIRTCETKTFLYLSYTTKGETNIKLDLHSLSRTQGKTFFPHTVEVDDQLLSAKEVFLVVVRYTEASSRGPTTYGNWTVYRAVGTEAEARWLQDAILKKTIPKKGQYEQWTGYFEELETVEIHAFRVTEEPVDPEFLQSTVIYHY